MPPRFDAIYSSSLYSFITFAPKVHPPPRRNYYRSMVTVVMALIRIPQNRIKRSHFHFPFAPQHTTRVWWSCSTRRGRRSFCKRHKSAAMRWWRGRRFSQGLFLIVFERKINQKVIIIPARRSSVRLWATALGQPTNQPTNSWHKTKRTTRPFERKSVAWWGW